MKKISINFENYYGIKKLEHDFNFSNRAFSVYAPNGVMKTSFAKTLDDYSKERETEDLAFPERKTVRIINSDDPRFEPSNVFVIQSYNEDYKSEKISTLLANRRLKSQYDIAHKEIEKNKLAFIKKLKQLSGLTGTKQSNLWGKLIFMGEIGNSLS